MSKKAAATTRAMRLWAWRAAMGTTTSPWPSRQSAPAEQTDVVVAMSPVAVPQGDFLLG